MLFYLRTRLTHLKVRAGGKDFYLVHGFPGENVHDEVWGRPAWDTPNPVPDCQLIIGHTPVLFLIEDESERIACATDTEEKGEYLRIAHMTGFIDIDCGCGHDMPIKALVCIRLDDMVKYYS